MYRAIELAKKGKGFTSPNPIVGAVVVLSGEIIGEGWHKKAGMRHAEVGAILEARKKCDLKDAIVYVTLEPCCHFGKTPPCTDLIIESGIKNVVIGMKDSFWRVERKGIKRLKDEGINVEMVKSNSNIFRDICYLNQSFLKWAQTGLPYVVMKSATTLDGKIATVVGESKWITGKKTRVDSRLERSLCDAVLVGCGTVDADDPELAAHGDYKKKKLLRVIIDPLLSLSLDKKVFRDENVFVACTKKATEKNKERFKKFGIDFKEFGPIEISVKLLLQYLGKKNITKLFVEGGSGVHGSFHDAALVDPLIVDEVLCYIAPKIFGGSKALSVVGGKGVKSIVASLSLNDVSTSVIDNDLKMRGFVNFYF